MKKSSFFNRKLMIITVLMMLMMGITAVVYAANTPAWWDNPGGTLTSWHSSGQVYGNAANSGGSEITITIDNDVITCAVGDHIELWVQIAWVNTGSPDVTLLSGGLDDALASTTNASGCPVDVSTALPTPVSYVFGLTDQSTFTPAIGNLSQPGNFQLDNGYERSHVFADSTATCARPRTSFNVPDGSGFEYRVETQSVCVDPTAVSLQSFSTNSADTLPAIGLIAFALLAIIGTGVALTRRQQA